jgi:hypothetical protein
MNRYPLPPAGVAALRPWPFGPPLRGRASRSDAGRRSAIPQTTGFRRAPPLRARPRRQATDRVGSLARERLFCC